MNIRRAAVLLGSVVFVGAVGVVAGVFEVNLTHPNLVIVALVALGMGLSALYRGRGGRTRAGTPDPERRTEVPVPGQSLPDVANELRGMTTGHAGGGRRIADGLRAAAVAVLTRFEGDSVDEATARLEDGAWTDDPVAAAFLSGRREQPTRSLRQRLASIVRGDSAYQYRVRHAVAAIEAIGSGRSTEEGNRPSLPEHGTDPGARADQFDRRSGTGSSGRSRPRSRTTATSADGTVSRREQSTEHWTGVGAVALLAVGVGVIAESPAVVLAGVVGVGYVGFARAFDPPDLDLSIERTLSDDDPDPGDEVDVTVTVTNDGDAFVPDLRIVDGVPAGVAVTGGSSRLGTALRPGESVTFEYAVTARRGSHEFDPALVLARDLSRSTEREFLVGAETTVVCEPAMRPLATPVPLRNATAAYAGRVLTAEGGSGTTIHSIREYRKTDPLNRIDWNRRAKTGELATLEFHEERAARAVVVVDARRVAYRAPDREAAHAVDRATDAAARIGASLFESGDSVGLAAIGPPNRGEDDPSSADPCWLPPASGRHHEVGFRESLATHPQFATVLPDRESRWRGQLRTFRRRLPTDTQVVLLTPLCDHGSVDIARRLEARGHPVTVVSPDPTGDRTAGQVLAGVARDVRRVDLQRAGIPVVDWPADESLETVMARHTASGHR